MKPLYDATIYELLIQVRCESTLKGSGTAYRRCCVVIHLLNDAGRISDIEKERLLTLAESCLDNSFQPWGFQS